MTSDADRDLRLRQLLTQVRHRWWIIAAAVAVAAGVAFGWAHAQPDRYVASSSLLFRDAQLDQRLFGNTFVAASSDPSREARTNLELVSLRTIAQRTAAVLGGGLTTSDVADAVKAVDTDQSDVVELQATTGSAQLSARMANAFAEQYIAFRIEADRSKIVGARQVIERQLAALPDEQRAGAEGRALRERAEQLGVFAELQTGDAELVQQASAPASRATPRPLRSAILGGALGLLFGLGVAVVLARLDRRVRDLSSFEDLVERPVLAAVPQSKSLAAAQRDPRDLPAVELEAFRMLRSRLRYFNVDRDIRCVMVTSNVPGEGKSTVALNLAAAAAGTGASRVLLVETDMRRPSLSRALGLAHGPGLAELLSTPSLSPGDLMRHVPVDRPASGAKPATFDCLPAGGIPPNSLELLESRRFGELLEDFRAEYDLVVIDTPPTSVVSDALPLMRLVDGVLVVARIGLATHDGVRGLWRQLEQLDAPVLGYVVNGMEANQGYGYSYEYSASDAVAPAAPEVEPATDRTIGSTR